jgi:hypothetical protein
MGADKVAMMVESRAPRNTPTHMLPNVITNRFVESSSGIMTCSVDADSPADGISEGCEVLPKRGARSSTSGEAPLASGFLLSGMFEGIENECSCFE